MKSLSFFPDFVNKFEEGKRNMNRCCYRTDNVIRSLIKWIQNRCVNEHITLDSLYTLVLLFYHYYGSNNIYTVFVIVSWILVCILILNTQKLFYKFWRISFLLGTSTSKTMNDDCDRIYIFFAVYHTSSFSCKSSKRKQISLLLSQLTPFFSPFCLRTQLGSCNDI